MKRHLFTDLLAAAAVIVTLVALIAWVMPDYLDRNTEEPVPVHTSTGEGE